MRKRVAGDFAPWALLLVLLAGCAALACSSGEDAGNGSDGAAVEGAGAAEGGGEDAGGGGEDADRADEEAVPIEVTELGRGRIESVLRYSTNLEAEREVEVFAEASRRVRELLVEEGDDVRRGQVLIRLQDEEQRTALARTEGQLERARREFDRQKNLYDQRLISEQAYNDARYELEQLELSREDATRQLGYTEVRAPIGGTITARLVNVGNQVTVNQHLFDIVDFDSIVARVYVPEKELHRIRVGQDARVRAAAAGGEERSGRVDRIAPRIDPRSGTVKVTVSIPRSQQLLPGMYVSVELVTEVHEEALLLPKRALVHDGAQSFVFRLRAGDRVERLEVRSALEDSDNVEPAAGFAAGDRIVVAGQAGLKSGAKVRVIGEPAVPPPDAAPQSGVAE